MASSLERLVARRVRSLPRGLQQHIYRVQTVALELASRHQVDQQVTSLAALAHDVARAMKEQELLERATELEVLLHPVERRVPVLLHGPVGAELLRQVDGMDDDEVYQAVRWHSTACPGMTDTAKVVFLADKLDPQKAGRYPYLSRVRDLAMESLDAAMAEFLSLEMESLLQAGSLLHPASVEARNELLMRLGSGSPPGS